MKKFLILFSLLFACLVASAKVVYIEVTASALGVDEGDASLRALKSCVGQVCGLAIASETFYSVAEKSSDTNNSSEYDSSSEFLDKIETSTSGVVSSYRILSSTEIEGGVKVEISAVIAKYETLQMNRRKIAVVPFFNIKNDWILDGTSYSASDVSRILGQSVVDYFTSTRKFSILDRDYSSKIESEFAFMLKESIDPADLCKRFSATGTDYLFCATVELLACDREEHRLSGFSSDIERKRVKAVVSYRLIDIATRQVLSSNTININESVSRKEVSAMAQVARIFAERSVLQVTENIYPIRVVGFSGKDLILNQGSLMVEEGVQYDVYYTSDDLKDPYTGESLGKQENKCARIEILDSKAKTSTASVLDSDIDFSTISLDETRLICRRAKVDSKLKKKSTSVKSLEKEVEDKW